ncbi:sugar phosphate isomerase/epimerase [Eubacteriales bacterium OttesenSCG-928-A19]|nr:sugar phosphate isomerase/epimerase [Eubacteriales bacterium OttesenSCG-928-A19]
MRLSTSTNIYNFEQGVSYALSMEDSVRVCAEAGYTYIDANLCAQCRKDMPLSLDGWQPWAEGIRRLADSLNVRITQAHAYWHIGYAFSPQGERLDGEWGEELMRRSVVAAQILGVEWMVVHPMSLRRDDLYSASASAAYNYDFFSRWAETYERHSVGMAIENMISRTAQMGYAADVEELAALIDRIDHPMVGACLDTGHAHLSGLDVPASVRLLGKRLKATHIADNHQNTDEHFAPFNGTIPWPEVMKALRDIQYAHDFSFEIQNLTSCYPSAVQRPLIRFSYELGQYLMGL